MYLTKFERILLLTTLSTYSENRRMQVVQTRPRRLHWEDSDWKLPNQHHPQLIKRTKAADALTPSMRDFFLTLHTPSPFSAHWENSVAHCKSPSYSIHWENSSCTEMIMLQIAICSCPSQHIEKFLSHTADLLHFQLFR